MFIRGLIVFAFVFFGLQGLFAAEKLSPGLQIFYSTDDNKNSDTAVSPNVWLYVLQGKSPSPFLPEGKFNAVWSGFVSVDLRSDYSFQAELNGTLKLEINGTVVLDVSGTNSISEISKTVRLNKGTNFLVASFSSPSESDAFVRLRWMLKGSFFQPVPLAALSHVNNSQLQQGEKLRRGRELFVEHRCIKCHVGPSPESGMPELAMDSPSFEGIGARRNFEWMTKWIADPKTNRASASMPKIFHSEHSKKDIEDIADFLTSLTTGDAALKKDSENKPEEGHKLFTSLHCVACHFDPENNETYEKKISLKQVAVKFPPGALTDFLKEPTAHYAWIRMPQFKLTDEQRGFLAAYLISKSDKTTLRRELPASENIEQGKKLVQTSGCLNCHSLKLENKFLAKSLAEISNWKNGCLAEKQNENSKAPDFQFSNDERESLQLFGTTDRLALTRHIPAEFAERQSRSLNCVNCHGQVEGVPLFNILGGKLKPEWSAKMIRGEIVEKPRPWLDIQMPAFKKRADWLAQGLAMLHGFSSVTPAEAPVNSEEANVGEKLVSAPPDGFSCIQCHAIGSFAATQVFEAPGLNLAHSGERLLPEYFKRWLWNPPLVDPTTKMPVYFDEEGKSPIAEVYEGSGEKQIDALWQYIRLGEKMRLPKTPTP